MFNLLKKNSHHLFIVSILFISFESSTADINQYQPSSAICIALRQTAQHLIDGKLSTEAALTKLPEDLNQPLIKLIKANNNLDGAILRERLFNPKSNDVATFLQCGGSEKNADEMLQMIKQKISRRTEKIEHITEDTFLQSEIDFILLDLIRDVLKLNQDKDSKEYQSLLQKTKLILDAFLPEAKETLESFNPLSSIVTKGNSDLVNLFIKYISKNTLEDPISKDYIPSLGAVDISLYTYAVQKIMDDLKMGAITQEKIDQLKERIKIADMIQRRNPQISMLEKRYLREINLEKEKENFNVRLSKEGWQEKL